MWVGERGVRTLGAAFLWSTDTVIECTARWTLYSRGGRCVWVGERGVITLGAAFLWSTDTVIECTARWTLYSRGGRCVWVGERGVRILGAKFRISGVVPFSGYIIIGWVSF